MVGASRVSFVVTITVKGCLIESMHLQSVFEDMMDSLISSEVTSATPEEKWAFG